MALKVDYISSVGVEGSVRTTLKQAADKFNVYHGIEGRKG